MDSKRISLDKKELFRAKRSRFDIKAHSVESLLQERQELYERLEISRDELDSYIRYMQKISDEKNALSQEVTESKMQCEILNLQKNRLENQNKILVKECSDLMQLLCKFGPQELYSFEKMNTGNENLIMDKIKDSVKLIFDERTNLICTKETLMDELSIVTKCLNESQIKIKGLNERIHDLSHELMAKQSLSPNRSLIHDIEYKDEVINVDNNSSNGEDSKGDTYKVNSLGIAKELKEQESFDKEHSKFQEVTLIRTSIVENKFMNRKARSESLRSFNSSSGSSNIEINLYNNSLNEIKTMVKNCIKIFDNFENKQIVVETSSEHHEADDKENECQLQALTDKIKLLIGLISDRITTLYSKKLEIEDENKMLNKELASLKYALTCRIEIKNHRVISSSQEKVCNCKEKIEMLEREKKEAEEKLSDLDKELEDIKDEKYNLLMLMASMAPE